MSFAERISTTPSNRPACWGDRRAYSTEDEDCQECNSLVSCRQEVASKSRLYQIATPPQRPGYQTSYRPSYRPEAENLPSWTPGPVSDTDHPFTRILKDMLMAALNGAFREGGRFTGTYRMK